MRMQLVPIEEFIIISTAYALSKFDPESRVFLISGDEIEGYTASDEALALDLMIHRGERFKLSFEADKSLMHFLSCEEHLMNYLPFFHPINNLEATIIKDKNSQPQDGLLMTFEIHFRDQKYDLKVCLYDVLGKENIAQ